MIEPLLVTAPLYERFRRGEERIVTPELELRRIHFARVPAAGESEAAWPENDRFSFPLFLPHAAQFREALIILNGLNDSSYRKFFPWAASLARAGMPVLIFPSAFLLNRRPREWITPTASERAWRERLPLAPDTATQINAPLSQRVAGRPRALLQDALSTSRDLTLLATSIWNGQLLDATGAVPFRPGTVSHLLGYSLGGYLALALRLRDAAFEGSKVIALCAGACVDPRADERLDPVSPFILDRHAAGLLLDDLATLRRSAAPLGPLAETLVELFAGTSVATRERIAALGSDLTVLAGGEDRVVPALNIAANLGRLDAVLPLGIHEYPFNLGAYQAAEGLREIARSHRVAPSFESAFRSFFGLVLAALRNHSPVQHGDHLIGALRERRIGGGDDTRDVQRLLHLEE